VSSVYEFTRHSDSAGRNVVLKKNGAIIDSWSASMVNSDADSNMLTAIDSLVAERDKLIKIIESIDQDQPWSLIYDEPVCNNLRNVMSSVRYYKWSCSYCSVSISAQSGQGPLRAFPQEKADQAHTEKCVFHKSRKIINRDG